MASTNATKPELSVLELVQLYYTPLLIFSGLIGNSFSVFVFCRTKLRKYSSSYYLATLAISDNIFLIGLMVVWLKMLDVDIFNRHGSCQVIVYVSGVCSFLSVWLVLAFTLERYIAVKYPFLRQSICTVERAKMGIGVLIICAFFIFSPLLMFSTIIQEYNTSVCSIDSDWINVANAFNYVDLLVTYMLPVSIIIYFNITISRTIINLSNVRNILTQGMKNKEKRQQVRKSFRISQNKITKMLLIVSTVFLCLNFPSYIMRLLTYLIELELLEIQDGQMFLNIQHWCLQLFYTNFGINFYLYCISGQNFRNALLDLFWIRGLQRTETIALAESRTASTGSSAASRRRKTQTIVIENQDRTKLQMNVLTG